MADRFQVPADQLRPRAGSPKPPSITTESQVRLEY